MATGKKLVVEHLAPNPYNGMKPYVLTDGMTGSQAFHDGNWFALYGDDINATIDLDTVMKIKKLTMNWLEAERSWIYLPEKLMVATSVDGIDWQTSTILTEIDIAAVSNDPIKTLVIDLQQSQARWVNIYARNKGKHPIYPDGKCWLFIDELRVE
ncbi:MAG: hypothetical protein JNJ57_05275 [Saprospiraceae bacterium]|nr:hypothetical protein [Saprospiraceae bacterium]